TPGAQGATGPRGPSEVLYTRKDAEPVATTCSTYTTILSLTLPAGTWLLTGSADMVDFDPAANAGHLARAVLYVGPSRQDDSVRHVLLPGSSLPGQVAPVSGVTTQQVVTTTAPSTAVSLRACRLYSASVQAVKPSLHALALGSATQQP
uniref:hypothetical protein n=1 Tax=Paraconexibacter sp. TaxID=2949640 RepID=UPI00356705F8